MSLERVTHIRLVTRKRKDMPLSLSSEAPLVAETEQSDRLLICPFPPTMRKAEGDIHRHISNN